MVKNFDSTVGVARKLIPKYRGTYKLSKILKNDRFVLEDVENFQQSRNPYVAVWAVGNIKPWLGKTRTKCVAHQSGDQGISLSGRSNCSSLLASTSHWQLPCSLQCIYDYAR